MEMRICRKEIAKIAGMFQLGHAFSDMEMFDGNVA